MIAERLFKIQLPVTSQKLLQVLLDLLKTPLKKHV